jgi:hypothetical protein
VARTTNYHDHIPWKVLENYLLVLREKAFFRSLSAEGLQDVGKCQGEALAYNNLLNLPETLFLRDNEEEKE